MVAADAVSTAQAWAAELPGAAFEEASVGGRGELISVWSSASGRWTLDTRGSWWIVTGVTGFKEWKGAADPTPALRGARIVSLDVGPRADLTVRLVDGSVLYVLPAAAEPDGCWSLIGGGRARYVWSPNHVSDVDEADPVPYPERRHAADARALLEHASAQAAWEIWRQGRHASTRLIRALNEAVAWLDKPEAEPDELTRAYLAIVDPRAVAGPRATDRLVAGQRFHREVQAAFVAGLVGAHAQRERRVEMADGRHGRADLIAFPEGPTGAVVIVEIKGTDWDAVRPDRLVVNSRRHVAQLTAYLDEMIDALEEEGSGTSSVQAVLLYPGRPSAPGAAGRIEAVADEHGIQVVWYEDAAWSSGSAPSPASDQ